MQLSSLHCLGPLHEVCVTMR